MKNLILNIIFLFIILNVHAQSIGNAQEKWTCYTDDKVLLMDDDHKVLGIFEYADDELWVITDRGINVFDGKQWKRIDQKTDLMRKNIASYLVDSKERVWIGTDSPEFAYGPIFLPLYHGGVVIYDGKTWKPMRTEDMGIKTPIVTNMFEATSGDIWLAVTNLTKGESLFFNKGALIRYTDNNWIIYKRKDLPCTYCEFVKWFYEDDNGRVYFWADYGLFYFENNSFTRVTRDEGYKIIRELRATFVDSKKNWWLATPGEVAMFDGENWKYFNRKNGLTGKNSWPYGFTETHDSKIILSAIQGLFYYDGNDKWKREKKPFLSGSMFIDEQNRMWVPTSKGLEIKEGENSSIQKDFPGVWNIFSDNNGGVWALSRTKGVKRYKDGIWTHYSKKNKLPSNKIQLGYVTKDGTVWIGTKKGICKCEYN